MTDHRVVTPELWAGGKIMRVADTAFTQGDDFCSVWHLFDLISEGAAGWRPRFRYAS